MNELDIIEAVANADDAILQKAQNYRPKPANAARYLALAACVTLVIALSLVLPRVKNRPFVDDDTPVPSVTDVDIPDSDVSITSSEYTVSTDDADPPEDCVGSLLNGLDYVLDKEYTPQLSASDMEITTDPATGLIDSYDAFCAEYSALDSDMNLCRYTVVERIEPEKSYSLTGDDKYLSGATLYRVRLEQECLADVCLTDEVYLYQPSYVTSQKEGMPLYCEGDTFLSPLRCVKSDDFEYYLNCNEFTFAVYEINGVEIAYHIGYENITVESDKYSNLNLVMAESERYVITSTVGNPVRYTQKCLLDELVSFLREDWAVKRMYFPLDEDGSVAELPDSRNYAYTPAVFNGSYDEKQCAFIAESYWLEPLLDLYPEEEVIAFRDNVYYSQSLTEQAATPVLYQAVKYFGITQAQLRELLEASCYENTELIVEAFWCGDETIMKQLLLGELSLYFDGNAYSLYDLLFCPSLRETVPLDVRTEYINSVKDYLESDSYLYEKVYRKFIDEMLE